MEGLKIQLESIFKTLELEPKNIELLEAYIDILFKWNKKINLISRKNETLVENFILHSLMFFKVFKNNNYNIVDLGSGAGFPAIVLKIYNPSLEITMIDSNHKKTAFLNYVCSTLSIQTKIINNSFENIKTPLNKDIISVKGVNIDEYLIKIIKEKIKGRYLAYFTSPNINLPLKTVKEKRHNYLSLKVYEL